MADLEGRMEELLREREDLRVEKQKWEAAVTNRRECLWQFTYTTEWRKMLEIEQVEFQRELRETERKLEGCEAAIAGLEEAAQRVAAEGAERRREEIAEMEAGIEERRRQMESTRVEETVRRARWAAMRGG